MVESTVGWFGVREKYCSLADKLWLINQIRPSEQAKGVGRTPFYKGTMHRAHTLSLVTMQQGRTEMRGEMLVYHTEELKKSAVAGPFRKMIL